MDHLIITQEEFCPQQLCTARDAAVRDLASAAAITALSVVARGVSHLVNDCSLVLLG